MKNGKQFDRENICDNPAVICRTCIQYVSAKNPAIPVNGDDTCLSCLEEAVTLLKLHVKEKGAADDRVRGVVAAAE